MISPGGKEPGDSVKCLSCVVRLLLLRCFCRRDTGKEEALCGGQHRRSCTFCGVASREGRTVGDGICCQWGVKSCKDESERCFTWWEVRFTD